MMKCKPPVDSSPRYLLVTLSLLICCTLLLPASLAHGSVEQKIQKTIALLEDRDYAAAIKILQNLKSEVLNPEQLNHLWASAYLGRGYQLLNSGELSAARNSFQNGRIYRKSDVRLWQGEAMAWLKGGRYAEAVSTLDQAIGYDPQNAELYYLLGRAYYASGRMAEAIDALERAQGLAENQEITRLLLKVQKEWQVEQKMEQEYRGHFQLSFVDEGPSVSLAAKILSTLEDAYAELGADLNYYPDVVVPVLLYTRREYSDVTGSPDWSGALYDGKIRLPLAGVESMHKQFVALLYHEYMHVLVHFLAKRQAPVWLNEGLAEVAGRRIYFPDESYADQLGPDSIFDWQTLSKPFASMDASKVPLAYEQSYSLAVHLIENYGWHKMTELLQSLGKGTLWQDAVSVIYEDFGLDWPAILKEWQASLN